MNPKKLNKYNVISIFESTLTRTPQFLPDNLYDELIIVRTYYYDILEDLVLDDFMLNDNKYVVFTASAGQIRTKKTVFIKESVLKQYELSLMCGLTLDRINAMGGVNVNKYLAYLALCNSATDIWKGFNIDECIVVDDLETNVTGLVDYIDESDFSITRKIIDVPICHTDGCGIVLPTINKKNFMVRLPWIKGMLAVCDFKRFIIENNANPKIKDIYGETYDIIEDNVKVLFFKSQFKMYKYYKDWDEYKSLYKQHHCMAGICNQEEDNISRAKFNYQMLQTLTSMTDEELATICQTTNDRIINIATDRRTMLDVFGANDRAENKTYYQQALVLYPELLNDIYSKEIIKQIKKSIVKQARGGRIYIEGRYLFIVPDTYAICEYLFLGEEHPKGLLNDGDIFCKIYSEYDKLDCLRSPHLSNEHAVRNNIVNEKKSYWFTTDALYVSVHDLISKILQFDVDGDKSLVCADRTIVAVAERDSKDFVPLYYEMGKAEPVIVTKEEIHKGLIAAYSGGNIGGISNDITKIWNSSEPNIDLIKILVAQTNFTIDYAKTLYKPTLPSHIKSEIAQVSKSKVPYFFRYAKGKTKNQIASKNNSVVNRLDNVIVNKRVQFTAKNLGKFNYKMLMSNPSVEIDLQIIEKYRELNTKNFYQISNYNAGDKDDKYAYYFKLVRDGLLEIISDKFYVSDVLVKYLYKDSPTQFKETLWQSFGDVILENLKNNITDNSGQCEVCGRRFIKKSNSNKYCDECYKVHRRKQEAQRMRRNRQKCSQIEN